MIKSSNKVVLKNEEGEILEISTKNFKVEKYINSTIEGYKYILEIDGNEINFSDSKKRTEFLKTINNCFVGVNFKFIITNNFKNKITDKVSNKKAYI